MKKQLAILGSTGSIGTQTLEVVAEYPDLFEVYTLTANNNVDLLIEQAKHFNPDSVVIAGISSNVLLSNTGHLSFLSIRSTLLFSSA